jgi:hypothetical protein
MYFIFYKTKITFFAQSVLSPYYSKGGGAEGEVRRRR